MPYWPPDSAPSEPPQMPGAPNAGPAPVPYGGPGSVLAPSQLAPVPDVSPALGPGAGVLIGVTGADHVTESPLAAPDVNPYEPGSPQAIYVGGDADAGGRDIVAGSVDGAVAAAHAWLGELQGDTYGQGSQIGDPVDLPGTTLGGFYDPPRDYGG